MSNEPVLQITVTKEPNGMLTSIGASDLSHEGFGLLVVDIIRHGAKAWNVSEDAIWEWIDKERYHPTTPITELKPN
jgi:hypothetical protein